jgi:pimeloyl-ACP methyl ester carboxylesterase
MATFGLAHGAWHGGWCWGLLVEELVRRGHVCVAPDLPFDDPTSTWDTVADVMVDALKGADEPVLVGHSLGALTIPMVALRRPVKLLVYLCPATPVAKPPVGSPPSYQERYMAYVAGIQVDELGRDSWKPDVAVRDMYGHVEPGLAKWAAAQLRPDAVHGAYPLEGPPSLPSLYIYTTEDEIFTPESRRWAARNVFGLEPVELDGGHFPMLEKPSALADLLDARLEAPVTRSLGS